MQGFSYAQLIQALQVWPLKASEGYLQSLNRIIYLGELRVIIDLDLDIFDVRDSVALAPGATSIPKPSGVSTVLAFTAGIALNAVSATLSAPWAGTTGPYVVTFTLAAPPPFSAPSVGPTQYPLQVVTLTNGQTTATWPVPMPAAVTASALLNPQSIVERSLFVLYNGAPKTLVKRSLEFVEMYAVAAPGQPRYYADDGLATWLIAPAADAFATAARRRYVQRPPSLVIAGNTWIGDNQGQLLFAACLMESDHWLKADDRYADWKTKYYEELLPNARGEVMIAARSGVYAPLAPIASVPGPPPQAPAPAG